MTSEPRSTDDIYESLKSGLTGRIAKLTNFTERSFNYLWNRAFSRELRRLELEALAAELSGYIDYSGGPVSEEDLEELGIENVDVDKLNELLDDEDLDELVKVLGVTRDPGTKATGSVTFETATDPSTTIPEGTVVTTVPESDGSTKNFETTEEITVDPGDTTGSVDVVATETGEEYNIPANAISRMESPPVGVRSVNNPSSTTGGEDEETNDELRERAKSAVSGQSKGGTVSGMESFIQEEIDAVGDGDVILDEFKDQCPPYVEVIVDGGTEASVKDSISTSRPVGIRHDLVRPSGVQVSVDAVLRASQADLFNTRERVVEYMLGLSLGESFYHDELIETIMRADNDILNISQLDVTIKKVVNERHEYSSGTDVYQLDFTYNGGTSSIVDEDGNTYSEGGDYDILDKSNDPDGHLESVDWDVGGSSPDDGANFFVDYTVTAPLDEVRESTHEYKKNETQRFVHDDQEDLYTLDEVPYDDLGNTPTISDGSNSYENGTDFVLVSDAGDEKSDTFTYQSGREQYQLDYSTDKTTVTIEDDDGKTYTRGSNEDFKLIKSDGSSLFDTIDWSVGGDSPSADQEFTVTYNVDNGVAQTIDWNVGGSEPSGGETFTVTYNKKVYDLEYDVSDPTETDKISDDQNTYTKGTDWEFEDTSGSREMDAVSWIDGGSSPSDGTTFYVSYTNERDRDMDKDQKVEPGDVTVTER